MSNNEQAQLLLTPRQLRNRRQRIIRDQVQEHREEKKIRALAAEANTQSSAFMVKFYIVVGMAILVTILALLHHLKPNFLYKQRTAKQRPYHLSTMYPPNVVAERDLPRFFRSYTIATPQNKEARMAAVKISASRKALKEGNGNLKVVLKAWDASNIDQLLEHGACGVDFHQAYESASSVERKEDLLMWCLLTTRYAEGFFLESVEMLQSAFIKARRRGMVVKSSDSGLSNAYYLHPRNLGYDSTFAVLPSKVLTWILANSEDVVPSTEEYRRMLREYIDALVHSEGNEDKYMILEEVCQPYEPPRSIGKRCGIDDCCYFVVPDSEGGNFERDSNDKERGESM